MTLLSVLPVFLLGLVAAWFVWPVVADPIARRRSARQKASGDLAGDELFRSLARHTGPEVDLLRIERG